MHSFVFENVFFPHRKNWEANVKFGLERSGMIEHCESGSKATLGGQSRVSGYLVPGIINGHSHAFQYVMAGRAEFQRHEEDDDFWSWREQMYQLALDMEPEYYQAAASLLYANMLENGYTTAVEFHYLHHDKNGRPYANPIEMSERIMAAAVQAGIRLVLVPVYYNRGGFNKEPKLEQRRFLFPDTDTYCKFIEDLRKKSQEYPHTKIGWGIHSLRAAGPEDCKRLAEALPKGPVHIHVAEQEAEVKECQVHLGTTPVNWLLQNLPIEEQWNLVHATHITQQEISGIVKAGANVVLCPTTEANLGDGIFPLPDFLRANGKLSIGSDANLCLSPFEELRLADYAHRLLKKKRQVFLGGAGQHHGQELLHAINRGAKGTSGFNSNLERSCEFDAFLVDPDKVEAKLAGKANIIEALIYGRLSQCIDKVYVAGSCVVEGGVHRLKPRIREELKALIAR